jgi:hypothetical protein
MKKTLLLLSAALLSITLQVTGQCTINTTYTTPGYYPASGFPGAAVTLPYSEVVQVRVLLDTTVAPYGMLTVNYVQMDSAHGLPPGFSFATNPSSGKFPGGSNGCLIINGNPTTGQELGGPTNNGIYPLTVYYHANLQVPIVGATNQPGNNTKYSVVLLNASASIQENQLDQFSVFQNTPNPAGSSTDIAYWAPTAGDIEFQVYNVLGSAVVMRTIHTESGNNKFTFDTSSLSPGIYLYSMQCGNKTVSRRMIVSAH